MKFMEKLEAYFNTGSVEKQNQKRLGGIVIGVTAVLLVVAMLTLGIGSIVGAIIDGVNEKKENEENSKPTVNADLVDSTLEAITELDNSILLNTGNNVEYIVKTADIKQMQPKNRPKNADGENLYMCENTNNFALQVDAFNQFTELVKAFYEKTGDLNLWVKQAYIVGVENNPNAYATAMTIQLDYLVERVEETSKYVTASTYQVDAYKWIYDNAYKYGFVRVSNEEGEENIFRYVGLDHAKYIESKNTSKKFYGVNDYLADLKNYTTSKLTIRSVKTEIAEGKTKNTNHFVYYVPAQGPYKLPDEKLFNYTVSSNNTDGYILTYWSNA